MPTSRPRFDDVAQDLGQAGVIGDGGAHQAHAPRVVGNQRLHLRGRDQRMPPLVERRITQ